MSSSEYQKQIFNGVGLTIPPTSLCVIMIEQIILFFCVRPALLSLNIDWSLYGTRREKCLANEKWCKEMDDRNININLEQLAIVLHSGMSEHVHLTMHVSVLLKVVPTARSTKTIHPHDDRRDHSVRRVVADTSNHSNRISR
jgi:hypothetical protein